MSSLPQIQNLIKLCLPRHDLSRFKCIPFTEISLQGSNQIQASIRSGDSLVSNRWHAIIIINYHFLTIYASLGLNGLNSSSRVAVNRNMLLLSNHTKAAPLTHTVTHKSSGICKTHPWNYSLRSMSDDCHDLQENDMSIIKMYTKPIVLWFNRLILCQSDTPCMTTRRITVAHKRSLTRLNLFYKMTAIALLILKTDHCSMSTFYRSCIENII